MQMANPAPKLLAVDDDVSSAELIARVAERCGYESFATSDSRGVVNLARALKPSLISVDICMPNIDARELFKLLLAAGYSGEVMIVSGQESSVLSSTRDYAEAIGVKVRTVVQKPLDMRALRQILAQRSGADKAA
jgi:two-component system chemotaxis response regulator CheB